MLPLAQERPPASPTPKCNTTLRLLWEGSSEVPMLEEDTVHVVGDAANKKTQEEWSEGNHCHSSFEKGSARRSRVKGIPFVINIKRCSTVWSIWWPGHSCAGTAPTTHLRFARCFFMMSTTPTSPIMTIIFEPFCYIFDKRCEVMREDS